MIIEKMKRGDGFTSTDKQIAQYLLHPQTNSVSLTSTELGRVTHTSQSAVIRFCNKLGYSSYRTFIIELAEERKYLSMQKTIDLEKPFSKRLLPEEAISSVHDIYSYIISNAESVIDRQTLQRVYNRIRFAKQIDIYGIGVSALSAKQLAFDLQGYGYPCRFMDGDNQKYLTQIKNSKEIIAIFYSFTGNNPSMNQIALKNKEQGIHCIAFTSKFDTPLSSICDESLFFATEYFDVLDNIAAQIGAMYVNHVLLSMFLSAQNHQ